MEYEKKKKKRRKKKEEKKYNTTLECVTEIKILNNTTHAIKRHNSIQKQTLFINKYSTWYCIYHYCTFNHVPVIIYHVLHIDYSKSPPYCRHIPPPSTYNGLEFCLPRNYYRLRNKYLNLIKNIWLNALLCYSSSASTDRTHLAVQPVFQGFEVPRSELVIQVGESLACRFEELTSHHRAKRVAREIPDRPH